MFTYNTGGLKPDATSYRQDRICVLEEVGLVDCKDILTEQHCKQQREVWDSDHELQIEPRLSYLLHKVLKHSVFWAR